MLHFTPDSAACWGGPFEGGYAQFHICDYTDAVVTGGSDKGARWLDHLAQAEKNRAEAAARDIFNRKEASRYPECPSWEFPIKFYMVGNDDTSYSKCYSDEMEALNELELFRGNEPLDFHEVVQVGFIFTN